MERGLSMFGGYIWNEYLVNASPEELSTAFSSARIRMAEEKTKCRVLVTNRVLNRLIPPAKLTRFAVVRVTGPDDESIALFNRLLTQAFPAYETRREYPRRAPVSVLNQNEVTKIDWNALRSVDAPELSIRDLRADISDTQLLTTDFENARLSQYLRSARRERFSLRRPTNPSFDSFPYSRQTLGGYDMDRTSTSNFSFGRPYIPGLPTHPEASSDSERFRSEYATTIGETARKILGASLVDTQKTNRFADGTMDQTVRFHSTYVKKRAPEVGSSSKTGANSGFESGEGFAENAFRSNTTSEAGFLHAPKSSRIQNSFPWSDGSEAPDPTTNFSQGGSLSTKASGIDSASPFSIVARNDLESSKETQVATSPFASNLSMFRGQHGALGLPRGNYEVAQVESRVRNMGKTNRGSSFIGESLSRNSVRPGGKTAVKVSIDLEDASFAGSKGGSITQGPETSHIEWISPSDNATQKTASKVEVGNGTGAAMLTFTDTALSSQLHSLHLKRGSMTPWFPSRPMVASSKMVTAPSNSEGTSNVAGLRKSTSRRIADVGKGSSIQHSVGTPKGNKRTGISHSHLSGDPQSADLTKSENIRQAPESKAPDGADYLNSSDVKLDRRSSQTSLSSGKQRARAPINKPHIKEDAVPDGSHVAEGLDAVLTYGLFSDTPGRSHASPVPVASQIVQNLGNAPDKQPNDSAEVFNSKTSPNVRAKNIDGGLSAMYSVRGQISDSFPRELASGIPRNEAPDFPRISDEPTTHGPVVGLPGVPVTTTQTGRVLRSQLQNMDILGTPYEGRTEPPPASPPPPLLPPPPPSLTSGCANEQLFDGWGGFPRSGLPVGLISSGGSNLNADGSVDEDPQFLDEKPFGPRVAETNPEVSRRSASPNLTEASGTRIDKRQLDTAHFTDAISPDLHMDSDVVSPSSLQHSLGVFESDVLIAAANSLLPTHGLRAKSDQTAVNHTSVIEENKISPTHSTKNVRLNQITAQNKTHADDLHATPINNRKTTKHTTILDQNARYATGGQTHTESPPSSSDSAGNSSPTPSIVAAEASKFYADTFF
ncbi:unnamed protein product, partial [Schistocephalus solidus]|uniref:RanBP2-type domain-containing protein n=1 Tax=Schistocephalus solidus TaxID=70667 RepID=A0A183TIS8_SCHSO